jgi:hypothetical protein
VRAPAVAPLPAALATARDGADWVFRGDGRVRLPLARALVRMAARVPALALCHPAHPWLHALGGVTPR